MANINEHQPEVIKEILKMQEEIHKLVRQVVQDVKRVKNQLGLWDVTR